MSKKIILFLSDYKKGAEEKHYSCPDGSSVIGVQTNDAPVKYLLRAYPDVSELLCIVTEKARTAALEPFREMVRSAAAGRTVPVTEIPFLEGQDFTGEVLGRIITAASPSKKQKKTEILLETTGGFRNAIMYLLLVSRALSYRDIHTAGAVYSNFNTGCVEDVSHLINLFDLVGGMQEMTNFGSVETLRKYNARPAPEMEKLLSAMERLKEDITLCRTNKERLDKRISDFNASLEQAENCADPLMRALLPAFQAKFDKKLSIPGLIKWCLSSDMLQQALTIYKERIPSYILEKKQPLLSVRENALPPENQKEYETETEARFRTQLLSLKLLEDPERYLCQTDFIRNPRISFSTLQGVLMDYAYIRMLRNRINHASEKDTDSQAKLAELLAENPRYKHPDQVTVKDVKRSLLRGLERLKEIEQGGNRH